MVKARKLKTDSIPHYDRYNSKSCKKSVEAYNIAEKNGLSLTQLALAFVNDRPFVTSNIIGATNISQLKENIDSVFIN